MGKHNNNKKYKNNGKERAFKTESFQSAKIVSSFSSNHAGLLFSDGNPMSFALVRKKIEDKFYQYECLDYIRYDPATVANPPVENSYDVAEPTIQEMVDGQITINRATTVLHWVNINAMVNTNVAGLIAADIAKINMSNAQKEIEALRAVDLSRTTLMGLYHTAHSNWTKLKDKHNSNKANCSKTFYSTFGPNILSSVQDMLHESRFRAAWKYIVDKYAVNIGGQNNASAIMKELTNLRYDNNAGMTNHINKLVVLFHQMETFGEPAISENMKMAYLVSSIKNSNNNQYQQIINMHEVMNWTYAELSQQLFKRESMLLVNNHNNKEKNEKFNEATNHSNHNSKPTKNNKNSNHNKDNVANVSSNSSTDNIPKCDFCHKLGHDKSNCWKCIPCTICGRLGHSTKNCYHNNKKKNNNSNNNNEEEKEDNSHIQPTAFTPRHYGNNT